MASTVTYKGATLTTVNNQTRVLLTSGKYMEDDVTITDVTPVLCDDILQDGDGYLVLDEDCPADGTVYQDENGFIVFDPNGGCPVFSWMGEDPELVTTYSDKVYLKDTGYATWTPSTTATKIVSGGDLAQVSRSYDYDYVIFGKFHVHFEYSGSSGTSEVSDGYNTFATEMYQYPGNLSDMISGTSTYGSNQNLQLSGGIFYKSTGGVDSYSSSNSYGVYINTVPNPTAYSDRTIPKSPDIYARCHSSYFSTANAAAVDQDASYYEWNIEIWKVKVNTTGNGAVRNMIREMWLHGF